MKTFIIFYLTNYRCKNDQFLGTGITGLRKELYFVLCYVAEVVWVGMNVTYHLGQAEKMDELADIVVNCTITIHILLVRKCIILQILVQARVLNSDM
jgi:hypothetical protein